MASYNIYFTQKLNCANFEKLHFPGFIAVYTNESQPMFRKIRVEE
jgi:hypothetical protein